MSPYLSLTEEIFDHLFLIKNKEDKLVKRIKKEDGSNVWKIGNQEFNGSVYEKEFEMLVLQRLLKEYTAGIFSLTEDGEKMMKKYSNFNN